MFFGPHNMKMSHHFISLWYPLKLGTFLISEDPPPNLGVVGGGGVVVAFVHSIELKKLFFLYKCLKSIFQMQL